jgi:hypothetical protein
MKKLSVLFLAAALVLAFTLPAAAVDHIFGGYWRARAFTNQDFSGRDQTAGNKDVTRIDSRTRLYYTAKFSDDFKFVNKFEFDWEYGQTGAGKTGGNIGADAKGMFEIKNSYIDFNTWQKKLNWKIGMQGYTIAKGFLFSDDFSGVQVAYQGDGFKVPFIWIKAYEGGKGENANDSDVDYYVLNPYFKLGGLGINPYGMLEYSDDARAYTTVGFSRLGVEADDMTAYWLGVDLDYKIEGWSLWATAIWNGGDYEAVRAAGNQSIDFKGYLFGLGGSGAIGPVGLHGQFVYSSGDDNPNDQDQDAFFNPRGASYYWSEIMGFGMFDDQVSNNSPGDQISNIWFVGGGVDYKVIESLKLNLDLWYAQRVEKAAGTTDEYLGTEVDLRATYTIMPKLNLDLVAAYLFAGDGTWSGQDQSDPYELGAQLSLSF